MCGSPPLYLLYNIWHIAHSQTYLTVCEPSFPIQTPIPFRPVLVFHFRFFLFLFVSPFLALSVSFHFLFIPFLIFTFSFFILSFPFRVLSFPYPPIKEQIFLGAAASNPISKMSLSFLIHFVIEIETTNSRALFNIDRLHLKPFLK